MPVGAEGRRSSSSSGSSDLLDLDVRGREGSAERLEGLLVEVVLDVQRLELGGGHAAALLCIVQEGGEGRVQFKGVSAQSFIRAQLILQGGIRVLADTVVAAAATGGRVRRYELERRQTPFHFTQSAICTHP